MDKIDLSKQLAFLWKASAKKPAMVDVPPMNFLMADGAGNPDTADAFQQSIEALYSLAYTMKFTIKKGRGIDFRVLPIEGLWWADSPEAFVAGRKDEWQWTLMIVQPDVVTPADVEAAREAVRARRPVPALDRVRFERFAEGRAAQILHVGPYAGERPTLERLHAFIRDEGGEPAGKHHEIYLSDPRRTAPERLRTILRQPVRPSGGA